MKLYRFSPISSEMELMDALRYLHKTSHKLCFEVIGGYLPVRGNVGIFCHNYSEFKYLTGLCKELTLSEPNYNGKYFPLKQPVHFEEKDGVPAATYEYLYIRQVDPYRSQVGDVDFVMPPGTFAEYTSSLVMGTFRNGARVFERPAENMIEPWKPERDVISYVATEALADIIRKQS